MKKLIILGASILQVPGIKKAKDMGLYVIALDMDPNAIGFKYADEHYVISTIDVNGVLELAKQIKPDGIMTLASDKPMITVARVGEELGLNTISYETSIMVTNKARMREALQKHNVPIPNFKVVSSREHYLKSILEFNDKFIVKPADSSGSRGIYLVDNMEQAIYAYEYSLKYSSTNEVLIEEYMEGPEVSVESITVNGETKVIAITDKETTGAPHFVELGHTIPSRLNEEIKCEIEKVTKQAINALGVNTGPSHTEIKITKQGPKIVELGARLGGDNITTHLVPLATGVDILKNTIEIALNDNIIENSIINKVASIKYLKIDKGVIKSITGVSEARDIKGIKQITLTKKVGDCIDEFSSSSDRVGFVIAQDNSYESVNQSCKEAIDTINIEV